MSRPLLLLAVASSCGSRTEGGITTIVEFVRVDRGPACVRVAVVDLASVGGQPERFQANNIDITDRPLTGLIHVGIARNPNWTDGVEVRASLHRVDCSNEPESLDKASATFIENSVQELRLIVRQSPLDGGMGGGAAGGMVGGSAGGAAGGSSGGAAGGSAGGTAGGAAGGSAGGTAGGAAGGAAGGSAGGTAGGVAGGAAGGSSGGMAGGAAGGTAGGAAGGTAAGAAGGASGGAAGGASGGVAGGLAGGASGGIAGGASGGMAGGSAGGRPCPSTVTPRYFTLRDTTTSWNDVQPMIGGDFVVVGSSSSIVAYSPADGGVRNLGGGTCSGLGDFVATSIRPNDGTIFIATHQGRVVQWNAPGQCSTFANLTLGFTPTVYADTTSVLVAGFDALPSATGPISLVTLNTDGGVQLNFSPPSRGQVWELSSLGASATFAVGHTFPNDRSKVWQFDPSNSQWTDAFSGVIQSQLYAIDLLNASTGLAVGEISLGWNGSGWSPRASPPFTVYGVELLAANEAYGVGADLNVAGFATWNGTTWTKINSPTPPAGFLKRIRGRSRCTLLGVGTDGIAVTTAP